MQINYVKGRGKLGVDEAGTALGGTSVTLHANDPESARRGLVDNSRCGGGATASQQLAPSDAATPLTRS
jgi:hypothetical protein